MFRLADATRCLIGKESQAYVFQYVNDMSNLHIIIFTCICLCTFPTTLSKFKLTKTQKGANSS